MNAKRFRAYDRGGDVLATGELSSTGVAECDVGEAAVAMLVFYGGKKAEEHVVGSAPIGGATGRVAFTVTELGTDGLRVDLAD